MINYTTINMKAWDSRADEKDIFTLPVSHEQYIEAKHGKLELCLTSSKFVPIDWYPVLQNTKVLGLASGGGQQGPILQAHGAEVTIMDLSDKQLDNEIIVAEREGYNIKIIKGDMTQPLPFANESFDMIFHPVSNCYVEEVIPIWKECARVLKKGGILMAGFCNPCQQMFELDFSCEVPLVLKHKLPYNPLRDLTEKELKEKVLKGECLTFSHSLAEQIGGQLQAGLRITHIYEDGDGGGVFDEYMQSYIATRAVKE